MSSADSFENHLFLKKNLKGIPSEFQTVCGSI